jgi:hypothetical protein
MTIETFLDRFEDVRSHGNGRHLARCSAHLDKNPSLSIREVGTKLLVKCWAGCDTSKVIEAVGLTMADLFTDCPTASSQRPTPSRQRMNRDDVAVRFELGALDRRLRAEQVLNAVATFGSDGIADDERGRLMTAIARAYEDQGRAEFLETVADDCRLLAYQERMAHHAA